MEKRELIRSGFGVKISTAVCSLTAWVIDTDTMGKKSRWMDIKYAIRFFLYE